MLEIISFAIGSLAGVVAVSLFAATRKEPETIVIHQPVARCEWDLCKYNKDKFCHGIPCLESAEDIEGNDTLECTEFESREENDNENI